MDLADLAALHHLTPQQVIHLHSAALYRVYMIGFMPGFAYLGGLDPRLHTSRRESPRLKTPAGSISIGGIQTAVGSVKAPSGWHLIGRTPRPGSRDAVFIQHRRPYPFYASLRGHLYTSAGARRLSSRLDMAIMANGLEVLTPGVYTTVQDEGRFGFEDCGVPPSGAMDEMSSSIANALVGNQVSTGVLEFTLTGATLRLTGTAPCRFAVTGDMQLTLDDRPLSTHCRHIMLPGSTLRVIRACSGARGYLAATPGTVPRQASQPAQRLMPQRERLPGRLVAGPQQGHFGQAGLACFLAGEYRVSGESDRMGYRLSGPPVPHLQGFNIVSDAISRDSIQIPGNGQPIIAMNDRQTTGGYPKIATVIRADLARLGQQKPGDSLRFEQVSVEKAESLWIGRHQHMQRWLGELHEAVLRG
ncbi:MAG: carboxyltransferase domain-containing protein [Sodalis sp. (in: enterobacteria)]|uniref:5-oxoprolinase subunit B/C family protein n=1 Tax=Sodalis sp. (in: enterobacteria) TaxID=1898979 RepID=UPI0039E4DF27